MIHPDSEFYSSFRIYSITEWGQKYLNDLDERRRVKYLARLEDSVTKARYQVLGLAGLLLRLSRIWEDSDPSKVVDRLVEIELTEEDEVSIRDILDDLLTIADELSAKDRLVVNRAVYRLLFRLPYGLTTELRLRCLNHRLKLVRMAAYRAIRYHGISEDEAQTLVEQYRESEDQRLLELVARWPNGIFSVDDNFVMNELRERYWRMRVIQGLLQSEPSRAWAHAEEHPILFVWAVGRIAHSESVRVIRALLEEHKDDPEFIWWCIWTFGRAGSEADVEMTEAIAFELLDRERLTDSEAA